MRWRTLFALFVAAWLLPAPASAQQLLLQLRSAQSIPVPPVEINFATNIAVKSGVTSTAASLLTVARAQTVNTTDLLPSSRPTPVGSINQFAANTPRLTPSLGLLVEGTRTNLLINATAPATQSPSLAASTAYTLWINGSGSAAVTANATCGAGTASQGNPYSFTTTATAGTCTVTPSGSVNAFQLEAGVAGSSLIVTAGASAARNADVVTMTSPAAVGAAYTLLTAVTFNMPIGFTANQLHVQMDDGTNTNITRGLRVAASGSLTATNSGTNGVGGQNPLVPIDANALAKQGISVQANAQASNVRGSNEALTVSGLAFTPFNGFTSLRFGGSATANQLPCYCYIARFQQWPTRALTPAQLKQLTRP